MAAIVGFGTLALLVLFYYSLSNRNIMLYSLFAWSIFMMCVFTIGSALLTMVIYPAAEIKTWTLPVFTYDSMLHAEWAAGKLWVLFLLPFTLIIDMAYIPFYILFNNGNILTWVIMLVCISNLMDMWAAFFQNVYFGDEAV